MLTDEKLYQYIDGELSEKERAEIDEFINSSNELKLRLEELKKIVTAPKFIKPLPPHPYFVNSLIENKINNKGKITMRKYIPIFGLIVLTIALMIFYKYNLSDLTTILDEQKNHLVEYYTKNLKPLFFRAQLTTDDVFSFAFNNIIPLDKDKSRFLKLDFDDHGKSYLEVRSNLDIHNLKTKENFSKQLNLNEDEKKALDTILNKYIDKIESQIVIGDNNSIGVNENLWQLRKAIAVDVLKFTHDVNKELYSQTIPTALSVINNPKLDEFVIKTINNESKNFVFLTPDTIFSVQVDIDADRQKRSSEYEKALEIYFEKSKQHEKSSKKHEQAVKEYYDKLNQLSIYYNADTSLRVYKNSKRKDCPFSVEIRDSVFRFKVPRIESIQIPNIDSILNEVDKIEIHLKEMNLKIPKINKEFSKSLELNLKKLSDSLVNFDIKIPEIKIFDDSLKKFELNIQSIVDSVLRLSLKGLKKLNEADLGMKIDSLSRSFKFKFEGKAFDNEKFNQQMEKFRKEMEKWRRDFERQYRENLKKEKKKIEEI